MSTTTFNAVCYFPETDEFEIVWVEAENVPEAREKARQEAQQGHNSPPEVDSITISQQH
jgi:hypothetical protein